MDEWSGGDLARVSLNGEPGGGLTTRSANRVEGNLVFPPLVGGSTNQLWHSFEAFPHAD